MVNFGVSHGCLTCKRRRKKCDEVRPSCTRCVKAKLKCLGYENETDLKFRNYGMPREATISVSSTQLGKSLCTAVDQDWIRNIALAEFLNDYCITPSEPLFSRGFLSGLRELLARIPDSKVAIAAETAAFASMANKQYDKNLSQRANISYARLLKSFSASMSNTGTANTLESLTTAVLLGIYEMISASKEHPGEHTAHCRGVAAILSSKSPVFRHHQVRRFWPENDVIKSCDSQDPLIYPDLRMIKMPADLGPSVPSLDTLLQTYSPVFRKGKLLTSNLNTSIEELHQFREYAITVDQEFALWPARQPQQWQPRTLGPVDPFYINGLLLGLTSSPSRIDVYLDVYVSSVWNLFRKCRLALLFFIYQCSIRLNLLESDKGDFYNTCGIFTTAAKLSEDLAASIPFHLVRSPEIFITAPQEDQQGNRKQVHIIPNVAAGGLLLMHAIFVVSTLLVVPEQIRQSCMEYLVWIGRNMGIRQAAVIADPLSSFPRKFIVNGHILVFTGTMVP